MGNKKWSIYIPDVLQPIQVQEKILGPNVEIKIGMAEDEAELIKVLQSADGVILTARTRMTRKYIMSKRTLGGSVPT